MSGGRSDWGELGTLDSTLERSGNGIATGYRARVLGADDELDAVCDSVAIERDHISA